ncbi:MAG: endonuclease/exonuclease/phosphatase family protein [Actinomycetota bacterium]|nr:endonuclease/exonuclease/phosphatase family protein [Actinomycetota bacterium]
MGWACALPPAGLAAARLSQLEGRSVVIAAEAITPLWFLPAYAALGLGLFSRQRALSVVAGALIALHLAWILPELRPARPLPAAAGGAPHIRIFSANLKYTNTQMVPMAEEIRRARPDVVLLQELSPANLEALRGTGIVDNFEFTLIQPRLMPTGSAVLSNLPMSDAATWDVDGMINARVTVTVGNKNIRIYDIHTNAPFGAPGATQWERQLAAIRRSVTSERGPLVVAGDFNASFGHRPFRALLDAGLRDAHTERGRGWATTWPRDLRVIPAFVRLDHVLVSHQFAVVGIAEGIGKGSDHRPVIADLAVIG